jgi:hypothetical protein
MNKTVYTTTLISSIKSVEFLFGVLWSIPVFIKLLSFSNSFIINTSWIISLICIGMTIYRPFFALISLPFLTLISPMIGFFSFPFGEVLLSDLFFLFLTIQIVIILISNKTYKYSINLQSLKFSILFIVSVLLAFYSELTFSLKPLLYLSQLYIIYYYTIKFAKNDIDKLKIINSWIFASLLGSLILIQAYINGQDLQNFLQNEKQIISDKSKLEYLFQATYYYSGFIFFVGISALILIIKLIFYGKSIMKLWYWALLLIFLLAFILMNNKTIIFSFVIVLFIIIYISVSNGYINRRKFLTSLIISFSVLFLIVPTLYFQFADQNQLDLMLNRFYSSSSFVARTEVYSSAFFEWISYPIHVLIGMGPDFLDGSGVQEYSENFKKSSVTGIVEGTVDSGWLSYLIELGIILFLILISLFYKGTKAAYQYFKYPSSNDLFTPIGLYVFTSLIFTAMALTTQMLGYTKTLWFPFQLFVFGIMFFKDRQNLKIEEKN